MRVLLISSTFPPEPVVAGRMTSDLARNLGGTGHEARVICPYPTRPLGAVYDAFQTRHALSESAEDGVLVTRVPSFTAPQSRLLLRMRESWSLGRWASKLMGDPNWKPDVIYEDSWPMFAQGQIARRASQLGIPRVSHIMDLYPESAFAKFPNWVSRCFGRPLLALDRNTARGAHKVVVLSQSMRTAYETTRGIPPQNITVLHTWQDDTPFSTLPDRVDAGKHYGLNTDLFTFMYLGNIGPVAGVDHIIRSFAEANLPQAQLLIVGEGSQKEACRQLADQTQAPILFVSDSDIRSTPRLQALADVFLLPLKRGTAFSSIPSKLSSYMLSARPVLAAVDADSETAQCIRAADCGWIIAPEDVRVLSDQMRQVQGLAPSDLSAMGGRGRRYAMTHLSKTQGVRTLARIVLGAAEKVDIQP
jgi:glycosyltransferase involved in cell wall biosynthesis